MFSTRWKKRITIPTLIWLSLVWSFAHAQEIPPCITCSTMAPELQEYINFANQMVDALDTKTDIMSNGTSYNVFGPWQWWTYNGMLVDKNPSGLIQSIVLWTLKNLDRRQSQMRWTIEVLSIYTTDIIKDGSLWFLVASQPWPIMRDFQYLLDIDTMISDKIYDLGVMGMQWKQLTTQERNAIIQLLENNTWEGKLFASEAVLSTSLSSTDILRLLLRINNRNKKTLTLSTTGIDNTVTANNSTLTLSDKHFIDMVNNYKCVRIGEKTKSCGWSWKDFKKSIDTITKSFIETGPKQSWEKINKAYKRLITRGKIIMGPENINQQNLQDYLNREHELITSRWDGQTLTKRSGRWILTWAISSNIPRQITSSRKNILNGSKEVGNIRKGIKNTVTPTSTPSNLTKDQKEALALPPSTSQAITSLALSNVIIEHQNMKQQQLYVATSESQEALSKITYRIRIINDLLDNTIKDDLTRTCNLQCSNLWGVCG